MITVMVVWITGKAEQVDLGHIDLVYDLLESGDVLSLEILWGAW